MKERNFPLKAAAFYLLLTGCGIIFLLAPRLAAPGGPVDDKGLRAIAVLCFAVVSWVFELAPIPVTALLVILLIPLGGLMTFSETIAASFGNSIFAFFLGVLVLSAAFQKTNLGRLIAVGLFRVFGRRPRSIIFGIMVAGAALAMWVTEVAAAAIMFPIALSVAQQVEDRPDARQLRCLLMLAVAWGPAFGGVGTPIATGANLIALDYLEQFAGVTITFFDWMKIGVPICITLLVVGCAVLTFGLKDNRELEISTALPSFGRPERLLLGVFLAAVALWVLGGKLGLSSHLVALAAAVFLFLPGVAVLDWKETVRGLSWDSIILICAGVVVGELLYRFGVAEWMSKIFFVPALMKGGVFLTGFYIVLTVSILKVLFSSNTVSGIIMVPIMISLADSMGASAWGFVAPCIFSTALSLLVITSSPVNVIPYASGYFTPKDLFKYGWVMTLAVSVIIAFWLMVFHAV